MRDVELPACAQEFFDERQTFAALSHRKETDWHKLVTTVAKGSTALRNVSVSELKESVLEISRDGAFDLARLISAGSLLHGPSGSLRQPDAERDDCLRDILRSVGEEARYFTNHGQAEEGDEADFLTSSYHVNALSETTIDVCLLGVSDDYVLVLWRFEDD